MTEVWKHEEPVDPPPPWPTDEHAAMDVPDLSTQWDGKAGSLVTAAIRHGYQGFRQNMSPFLVIGLVLAGFSIVMTFVQNAVLTYEFGVDAGGALVVNGPSAVEVFFVDALYVVLVSLLYTWFANASHRVAVGGQRLLASDAFKVPQVGVVFWAAAIMFGATTIGFLLLVVPGVLAWLFLCFTPLAALDGAQGVGASIRTSTAVVRANVGPVLLVQLAFVLAIVPMVLIALAVLAATAGGGAFGVIVGLAVVIPVGVALAATAVGAKVYAFRVLQGKPVAA